MPSWCASNKSAKWLADRRYRSVQVAGLLSLAPGARSTRPIQILGPIILLSPSLHHSIRPTRCAELYLDLTYLASNLLHISFRRCSRMDIALSTDKPPMSINLRDPRESRSTPCGHFPCSPVPTRYAINEARQYGHACLDQRRGELKAQCLQIEPWLDDDDGYRLLCFAHFSLASGWILCMSTNGQSQWACLTTVTAVYAFKPST